MIENAQRNFLEVISGSRKGLAAGALRAGLSAVEPFYAGATLLRNRFYDNGLRQGVRLSRPVISVGNLTAGGTGKTPMVRWLACELRSRGKRVAILSRGYKAVPGRLGDEQIMLDKLLNGPGMERVAIEANPSRVTAAEAALRQSPEIDVFLLDDGFQHRRVARDLDIVLLSAIDPFGLGHVLPRGLLREPISGLKRAGAVVITHADQVDAAAMETIAQSVRRLNPDVPIYHAEHQPAGLRTFACPAAMPPDQSLEELGAIRFFAFCGIGNPHALHQHLQSFGASYVGHHWFADHHAYTASDLDALRAEAQNKQAAILLTTEKDWVKVAQLPGATSGNPETWRLDVRLQLPQAQGTQLLGQVMEAARSPAEPAEIKT